MNLEYFQTLILTVFWEFNNLFMLNIFLNSYFNLIKI